MWAAEVKAKIDIPLEGYVIKKGEKITITRYRKEYCLWHHAGMYAISKDYIDESGMKILSKD